MLRIKNYLSLIKFSHTIFALPFAFIGFTLGILTWNDTSGILIQNDRGLIRKDVAKTYDFPADLFGLSTRFLLVMACMITARSAAMAFNRYLDREYDKKNPRTTQREIPAGVITAKSALYFTIICCLLFILAAWFINPLCFILSPVALFTVLFYSYTKRFTSLCHLILGVGLSLAPIGAYLAVTGRFDILPLLFSCCVICWVTGFDIIYALQDESFDKEHHLKSIPVLLGKIKSIRLSEFLHLMCAILITAAGWYGDMGIFYWTGAGIFCALLIYQHWLIKPDDLSNINLAFMTTNGIASVIFSIFVLADRLQILF